MLENIVEKGEIAQMSNFTFFHNVFYAIFISESFNTHISVVVCSFFEFGTDSKWCIWEWVKPHSTIFPADNPLFLWHLLKTIPL